MTTRASINFARHIKRNLMTRKVHLNCQACGSPATGHCKGVTYYLCGGRQYRQKVEGKWVEVVECQGNRNEK